MHMGRNANRVHMTPEELKAIRHKMGLTQADFAEKLLLSLRAYIGYERGETQIPGPVAVAARCLAKAEK